MGWARRRLCLLVYIHRVPCHALSCQLRTTFFARELTKGICLSHLGYMVRRPSAFLRTLLFSCSRLAAIPFFNRFTSQQLTSAINYSTRPTSASQTPRARAPSSALTSRSLRTGSAIGTFPVRRRSSWLRYVCGCFFFSFFFFLVGCNGAFSFSLSKLFY